MKLSKLGCALLFCFFYVLRSSDVTIDIVKNIDAVPNIQVVHGGDKDSQKIALVLKTDLTVSGNFNVHYSEDVNLGATNVDKLLDDLTGKVDLVAQVSYENRGGKPVGNLVLHDVRAKTNVSMSYTRTNLDEYPFLAHAMAVYINDHINAPPISWMNEYVVAYAYRSRSNTDILLTDYTMEYKRVLVSGGVNLFPKWASSDKREFYYTKVTNRANIYKYNIDTGANTLLLASKGMAVVSDVSRNGEKLLLSLAPDGLSDIYLLRLDSKKNVIKRLTTYSGIDVNANFIDNESAFAFVSDRLGYPTVFRKSFSGAAGVEQLVFQGKNNSSLSSFNHYVVYSSREGDADFGHNTFNLYLISTQSDYIRRLSKSGTNTVPKFADSGDTVMYLKHVGNEIGVGIIRLSINKSFLFPLGGTKVEGFDW